MTTTRRDFLKHSLAAGSLVAWGLTVPDFLSRTACAAPNADKAGAKDTILVVVQLTGGNDGLNTVIPFKDAEYAKLRPTLKHRRRTRSRSSTTRSACTRRWTAWPSCCRTTPCASCRASAIPNPSQSHFRSMDIWQAASTAETLTEGWIGKALQGTARRAVVPPGRQQRSRAAGPDRRAGARAVDHVAGGFPAAARRRQRRRQEGPARRHREAPPSRQRQAGPARLRAAHRRQHLRQQPAPAGDRQELPAEGRRIRRRRWPTGSSWRPSSSTPASAPASSTSRSTASTRTPARRTTHANLLRAAVRRDDGLLQGPGGARPQGPRADDDVLRVRPAGQGERQPGTDHGSAAPMLLVGGKVKAGVVGEHPSLTKLEMGNLKHHTDFRQVYAADPRRWLGVPARTCWAEVRAGESSRRDR